MKTKVLTVFSATVTATCLESDWHFDQERLNALPLAAGSRSLSRQWVPPHPPGSSQEHLICYELEEQWLLVRQPDYLSYAPQASPQSSDRGLTQTAQFVVQKPSRWQLPPTPDCHLPVAEWHLLESPLGSQACLAETDCLTPSFVLDQAGQYKVRFRVCPQLRSSQSAIATPVIISDLLITTSHKGADSLAIALADFTINPAFSHAAPVPYLFRVTVYVGFTYL